MSSSCIQNSTLVPQHPTVLICFTACPQSSYEVPMRKKRERKYSQGTTAPTQRLRLIHLGDASCSVCLSFTAPFTILLCILARPRQRQFSAVWELLRRCYISLLRVASRVRSHVIFAIRGSDGQTAQHYNRTINMRAKDTVGFASRHINVEVGLRRCCKLVDAHAARKLNHFWRLKSRCPSILAV